MSRVSARLGLFFTRYGVQPKPGPPAPRWAIVFSIVIAEAAVHAVNQGSW